MNYLITETSRNKTTKHSNQKKLHSPESASAEMNNELSDHRNFKKQNNKVLQPKKAPPSSISISRNEKMNYPITETSRNKTTKCSNQKKLHSPVSAEMNNELSNHRNFKKQNNKVLKPKKSSTHRYQHQQK